MSKEFYEKEMAMFSEQAKECSIIITTAAIPGEFQILPTPYKSLYIFLIMDCLFF